MRKNEGKEEGGEVGMAEDCSSIATVHFVKVYRNILLAMRMKMKKTKDIKSRRFRPLRVGRSKERGILRR